ncbi:hypothetical protein Baya_2577 [Bagarius yarrelli]|uniref:Uncharacterized protein n=1 Tax=Bagarius yarrelli TaxID=175774 RepID=A0A556VXY9_BAGYA|nr:hypothetical protein Baya_2577 [Bagarius yarrelli]
MESCCVCATGSRFEEGSDCCCRYAKFLITAEVDREQPAAELSGHRETFVRRTQSRCNTRKSGVLEKPDTEAAYRWITEQHIP